MAKTHCRNGHTVTPTSLARQGNFPNGKPKWTCRHCLQRSQARASKRQREKTDIPRQTIERIIEVLEQGGSFNTLRGRRGNKHFCKWTINTTRLIRFCDANPKIGYGIRLLAKRNARILSRLSKAAPQCVLTIPSIVRWPENALETLRVATANILDHHTREETISLMVMAIAEGRLDPADAAKRVQEFTTQYYRLYSKYVPNGGGIFVSLNAPISHTDDRSLIETIAETQGLWRPTEE